MARLNQNRSKLLLGCGSAAMAMGLAMSPNQASAQAIQATETEVVGSISRNFTGTGSETITVNTPVAVVDWTPDEISGVALDYLPTGAVVTFQNDPNLPDFAILNRILPSSNGDVVVFDGTVISRLIDPQTGASLGPGGTVAFYSPTGIFVGGNAVFDVGNLILTTLDPDIASFSDFALSGGQLQMNGGSTTAQIIINPGAQILASAENSYFAVTAAEIQMLGTSTVNGSTAFVAGEAVNLTVSNGLFDIQIPVGTTVGTPIVVDGNVGGPSSNGVGDNHLIYAVAAAQSDPISLLFRGNLGFAPAASAGVVNGEIILSANYNVTGRSVAGGTLDSTDPFEFFTLAETTPAAGSIFVEDFTATSSLLAMANEEVQVSAVNGPSQVDGRLYMIARRFSELTASNGQSFTINGDVMLGADGIGFVGPNAETLAELDGIGGNAFIDAFGGGTLTINGNALVTARGAGGADTATGDNGITLGGLAQIGSTGGVLNITGNASIFTNGQNRGFTLLNSRGDVTGGTSELFSRDNGQVTIGGTVNIDASASSAGSTVTPFAAGNATGGFAGIVVNGTGSILVGGDALLSTFAAAGGSFAAPVGATGRGGNTSVFMDDAGSIDIGGQLVLGAQGVGGSNTNDFSQGGRGGDGIGGAARAFIPNGGALTVGNAFSANATGTGGTGLGGGDGFGGIAGIQVLSGLADITGDAFINTTGAGADASNDEGGDGGNGAGGNSFLQADGTANGGIARLFVGGNTSIVLDGIGGRGADGNGDNIVAGNGGTGIGGGQNTDPNPADPNFGTGGFLLSDRDNAIYSLGGSVFASAQGIGGAGGDGGIDQNGGIGGDGLGGFIQVGQATLTGTTTLGNSIATADFGDVTIFTNGVGGSGGFGNGTGTIRGNGGFGIGGGSFFTVREGDVTAGAVSLNADGTGGGGEAGGDGVAGLAIATGGAQGTLAIGSLSAFAVGRGGSGVSAGGNGVGGSAGLEFVPDGMTVNIANNTFIDAGAFGGSTNLGAGGAATGGDAFIEMNGDSSALITNGSVEVNSAATAGDGTGAATGAGAEGGFATIRVNGLSTIDINGDVAINVSATGGDISGLGEGGLAIGGLGTIDVSLGGAISIAGNFSSSSQGLGGSGANGGDGFGGFAAARVTVGTIDISGDATADSSGRGGNAVGIGGVGGTGNGGLSALRADGTLVDTATLIVGGNATLFSNAFGGTGGPSDDSTISAGSGGDAFAGSEFDSNVLNDAFNNGAYILAGGDNGNITIGGQSQLGANAFGGDGGSGGALDGGTGGNGTGGSSIAGLTLLGTDGSIGAGTASFGDLLRLGASGSAGNGGSSVGAGDGDGGDGTGGRAFVVSRFGTLTGADVVTFANGFGGDGSTGGDGTGGSRVGILTSGGGSFAIQNFNAVANGIGGLSTAGVGGQGTGGQAFIGFQDGTGLIDGDVFIDASGAGGDSAIAAGGAGVGGIADIAIFSALTGEGTITGHANVFANGFGGGGGEGAVGGSGTGGEAYVLSQAGGTITLGSAQILANGQGGSGATIQTDSGTIELDAAGGDGIGGLAYISAIDAGSRVSILRNTPLTQSITGFGVALLSASGFGGEATAGTGIGGAGTGGEVLVSSGAGTTINLPLTPETDPDSTGSIRILARGQGGSSSVGSGVGGLGTGGLGTIEADGGTINSGATQFSVFGVGGNSLDSTRDIDGGDGIGGQRDIIVSNGGELTIELPSGVSGAVGGQGSGSGNGGDATGGSATLTVTDATANLVGRSIIVNQNFAGSGATGGNASGGTASLVVTGGSLNVLSNSAGFAELLIGGSALGGAGTEQGGNAVGADASVLFSEANVTGGAIGVSSDAIGGDATGTTGVGGDANAGDASISLSNTSLLLTGSLDVSANANGGTGDVGGLALGGSATLNGVGSDLQFAEGDIEADATGGEGNLTGDATAGIASVDFLDSNVQVTGNANGPGSFGISSQADAGSANEAGTATGGTAGFRLRSSTFTADDLSLSADAEAEAFATGAIGGVATGGTMTATVVAGSDLTVGSLSFDGSADSSAGGSSFGAVSILEVGSPDTNNTLSASLIEFDANAQGGNTNAAGQFTVFAASGTITTENLIGSALGDEVNSDLDISSLTADGGSIFVSGIMDIDVLDDFDIETALGGLIGGPDVLDPTADIDIVSQGTISIIGDDDNFIGFGGLNVTLTSRDIDVEDGARFGAVNLTLRSLNTDDPAIIGGDSGSSDPGPGEGYVLSQDEASRIEVGDFLFIQPLLTEAGPNDPDIILRDITAIGSLDDGAFSITVSTDGSGGIIRAEGLVVFQDAGSTDVLTLSAPGGRIEVVTPGGIGVVDSSGNPSGILFLEADQIWAADSDLIALLQDNPVFAGRNDQLAAAASGSEDPLGFIRGGEVNLSVGSSLLVRNTGTETEQGGILVGEGGLSIFAPEGSSNSEAGLDVFAYGARIGANGELIVGEEFFREVRFNNDGSSTSTLYANDAEFNDCLINTAECAVIVTPEPPPIEEVDPVVETINNPAVVLAPITSIQPIETSEQDSNEEFGIDFPGFIEAEDINQDSDIEDPVASGGDSSLYGQTNTGNVEVEGN